MIDLGPVHDSNQPHQRRFHGLELDDAHLVVQIQHVCDVDFIKSITVDIGKIHGHRKSTGIAQGNARRSTKAAMAIIEPNSIRRHEVVTDVEVRRAIAIEIAKGRGQAPILRRLGQGVSVLIQEHAISPGGRAEAAMAIVHV